jgi:hypothetical protein
MTAAFNVEMIFYELLLVLKYTKNEEQWPPDGQLKKEKKFPRLEKEGLSSTNFKAACQSREKFTLT